MVDFFISYREGKWINFTDDSELSFSFAESQGR